MRSSRKPTRKAKEWHRRNKWFGVDEELTAYALLIHVDLLREKVKVDSDKYYQEVDRRMFELVTRLRIKKLSLAFFSNRE